MSKGVRIRLDKLLANMGIGTRSEVKKIIRKNRVKVDDKITSAPNTIVYPDKENVTLDDKNVNYSEFFYFILNKPQGVISATYDNFHKTVIDLLDDIDSNKELFPVGRLDIDTEGLLILSNDGQMAHKLLSPKKGVPKTYFARINGPVDSEDIKEFKEGITLSDGEECKPAGLKIIKSDQVSEVEITITEGKFHQVKKMVEEIDSKVIYLKRISMGDFNLPKDLQPGEYRKITKEELETLLKYT